MGALDNLYCAARAYLASRPDCAAYMPTVTGASVPQPGAMSFAQSDCSDVVRHMDRVAKTACPATKPLVDQLLSARDAVAWFQVYKPDDLVGKGKIDRMAVSLLAGPGAAFDPEHGRMRFYFLRDGVEYAPHAHAPREIYAILSGTARYWNEVSGWSTYGPGDVIYTPAHRWHAMTTCNEPVLILWAWIGEDLNLVLILWEEDQGSIPDGA